MKLLLLCLTLILLHSCTCHAEFTPLPADTAESTNKNFKDLAEEVARVDAAAVALSSSGYVLKGTTNAVTGGITMELGSLLTAASGSTVTVSALALTGVSTPTANSLWANTLNQAMAVFVTSGGVTQLQYSIGVTSVTFQNTGSYMVNWQRPFTTIYYHRGITAEDNVSEFSPACGVSPRSPLSASMTDILCVSQTGNVFDPNKIFIMATGPQ